MVSEGISGISGTEFCIMITGSATSLEVIVSRGECFREIRAELSKFWLDYWKTVKEDGDKCKKLIGHADHKKQLGKKGNMQPDSSRQRDE